MAILYVNSITGLDANNGSTWALAKKTLAGVNTTAAAGDTIYAHGIFNEAIPVAKTLVWIANGLFVIDGTAKNGSLLATAALTVIGATFTSFIDAPIKTNGSGSASTLFVNCEFRNQPSALSGTFPSNPYFVNCSFFGHTTAAIDLGASGSLFTYLHNCVFSNNAIGIRSAANTVRARYCAFRDVIMWSATAQGQVEATTDFNVYDFSVGKCVFNAVDKTTLATWQAAIGAPKDTNSIDRVWSADVGDYANGVLRSNPASYLLTAGPGGTPLGLQLPALTLSNNRNASLWTGGVFSNCEIDGSGYLVLSAGQTVGTYKTNVIDFGAAINAKSIEISLAGEGLNVVPYVDYDTADSPGYYNVRVRGSNTSFLKTDASPSWVIVPRRAEIGAYMSNALRYWQVELTLRS